MTSERTEPVRRHPQGRRPKSPHYYIGGEEVGKGQDQGVVECGAGIRRDFSFHATIWQQDDFQVPRCSSR